MSYAGAIAMTLSPRASQSARTGRPCTARACLSRRPHCACASRRSVRAPRASRFRRAPSRVSCPPCSASRVSSSLRSRALAQSTPALARALPRLRRSQRVANGAAEATASEVCGSGRPCPARPACARRLRCARREGHCDCASVGH